MVLTAPPYDAHRTRWGYEETSITGAVEARAVQEKGGTMNKTQVVLPKRAAFGLGLAVVVLAVGVAANHLWQRHEKEELRIAASRWHRVNDTVNNAATSLLAQEIAKGSAAVSAQAPPRSSAAPKATGAAPESFEEWNANLGLTPSEVEARRQRLEAQRAAAGDMTLERARRIVFMRTQTGLDPAYINEHIDEVENANRTQRAAGGAFDVARYRREHPSLDAWLTKNYGPEGTR